MEACLDHGSGIIIITACGIERPESTMSSSTLSNIEESEPFGLTMGGIFLMSSPNTGDWNSASRARIQLMLPRSVLISPLCAMQRYGCARSQLGKVLVEKRECTSAMAVSISGFCRSRKYWSSWLVVSMPL